MTTSSLSSPRPSLTYQKSIHFGALETAGELLDALLELRGGERTPRVGQQVCEFPVAA